MKSTPLLVLIALLLIAVAYLSYRSSSVNVAELAQIGARFETKLSQLRPLETIQLDVSVFQEDAFRYLELPVIPEIPVSPPGRPNPFLPQ